MQAIFSVLAILGAIGIAWTQHQAARSHVRKVAEAAAAVMVPGLQITLVKAIADLDGMSVYWQTKQEGLDIAAFAARAHQHLTALEMPTDDDLRLLVELYPEEIQKIAHGRTTVRAIESGLPFEQDGGWKSMNEAVKFLFGASNLFHEAVNGLPGHPEDKADVNRKRAETIRIWDEAVRARAGGAARDSELKSAESPKSS